jgi:hypothetical protein
MTAVLRERIFDSWARMQLDLVDLHHAVNLVRANGGTRETIEGIEATIALINRDAAKLRKIWDERKEDEANGKIA